MKDDKIVIYYIDRKTGAKKEEVVAGGRYLRWMHETKLGSSMLEILIKKKFLSVIYGKMQDLPISRRKIASFIKELDIDMQEAENEDPSSYKNFNEFFIRRLKKEARPICMDEKVFVSPADGRVMAYENIHRKRVLQIKGQEYCLEELLQNKGLAAEYQGGACITVRLSPADYHRFHFPDEGVPEHATKIAGGYYSVNPIALRKITSLYCQNKREFTVFDSYNFGRVLMVEVGATFVGSIIQTFHPRQTVKKGEEKGYFKFGGSTVILFLQPNRIKIDRDLIENTQQGIETKVHVGEKIGIKK
ncbi:Phosphatidylserine decarboxylase proenzyme [Clostridium formicaceticum]|uniref:Phosphatidylserine decarboxylase proenzyme n=1 Tax=Clostridium formicaceticum TaxID=1497 RepID=A0AAC9RNI9_9CLOT|nr:phosphatidylserine decarboxylase [Clostridium formicaceticum]ARE89261.1 Phosphatidylserine decarboxylase proenzyme [Clostridium formicaceticum]